MKTVRRSLLLLYPVSLVLFAVLSCFASTPAWAATGYGEVAKVKGSEAFKVGEKTETDAFGVNASENNDFFVGEEPKPEQEEYRIREYSSTGTLLGGVTIPKPTGTEPAAYGLEGIAIDATEKRLYALVLSGREHLTDDNVPAAGKIYTFKTVPNGSKVLEPACSCAGGLLADETTLNTQSQTLGSSNDALLEPDGIAVDPNPATHENELVILGKDDERKSGELMPVLHMAVQHVTPAGVLGERYVAPESSVDGEDANSPVATPNGNVYFQRHEPTVGDESVVRVPDSSSEAPVPVYQAGSAENLLIEPLYEFDPTESAAAMGDGLSFVAEASGAGRAYSGSEIELQAEVQEEIKPEGEDPGILALAYQEQGTTGSFSEHGWTGGATTTKPCGIGGIGSEFFPVAAAGEEKVFVLDLVKKEVLEFGPGGTGCPTASAKLVAEVNKTVIAETEKVPAGTNVTLSSLVVQGDVLKVEWEFDEGAPALVETGNLAHEWELHPTQETLVTHKFEGNGPGGLEPTITETIYTDNLATPEVKVVHHLKLTALTPKITRNPGSVKVTEGEQAQFTATASGSPKPTVQWQVKRSGGAWTNDTTDTGNTTTTLTIGSAALGESGSEYRAVFENTGGKIESAAAMLTVEEKPTTTTTTPTTPTTTTPTTTTPTTTTPTTSTPTTTTSPKPPPPKPLTRAQLFAKALKACKKLTKGKRLKCELAARKKYGPKPKPKKKK